MNIKSIIKGTVLVRIYRNIKYKIKVWYHKTLSDEQYLNKTFTLAFGRKISATDPKTFNEKLQWLKLYWYDSKAEICSDKYEVREYIKSKGLGFLLNELIYVFDSTDEIEIEKLPDQFVLKCTHGSGCNIICRDKSKLNWKTAKKKLKRWMRTNYYWQSREWVYKNCVPRIICERYLEDDKYDELIDFKFFCFNGEPKYIMVATDRFSETGLRLAFYDIQWNLQKFERDYPMTTKVIDRPKHFQSMIEYARILSKEFPFVRVDFYEVNEKVYFGELTFFPGGGFEKFQPEDYDYYLGSLLELPKPHQK